MQDNFVAWLLVFFLGSALLGGMVGGAIAYFGGWGWVAVWLYAKGGAQVGPVVFAFVALVWFLVASRKYR